MKFLWFLEQFDKERTEFECPECEEFFPGKSVWLEHNKVFHGKVFRKYDKDHNCYVCNEKFNNLRDLTKHSLLILGHENPYQCSECLKTFKNKKSLRIHKQDVHETIDFDSNQGKGF